MKRIRTLDEPTPGLADYLDCEGAMASWEGFRSHWAGAAYRELIETLQTLQHGLCGYCEIDVTEQDRQVEHVVPQSDPQRGAARALDAANLIACCKGGTSVTDDDDRRRPPVKRNRTCGEAKGDSRNGDFIEPRSLPALPSLTRVRPDGRIEADQEACAAEDVDAGKVNRTIAILGLNVERLRLAREKRWRALNDNWRQYHDDPQLMTNAARMELLPDVDGNLPGFFTTSRSYFAPLGESILAADPRAWI